MTDAELYLRMWADRLRSVDEDRASAMEARDKGVFLMHDEGASLREIARVAGISHRAVAKILERGTDSARQETDSPARRSATPRRSPTCDTL